MVSPTGRSASDYDPNNGFEVVSSTYQAFPIDKTIPEDPVIVDLLQPYVRTLDRVADLDILVGYSPGGAKRTAPQGGDSPLGNLVATAMWLRLGVQTDISLTNTTGLRTDLNPGPITIEEMYNIFPFDNSISKMQLSGLEVQEMFDFVARRSAGRGCTAQAQIAGARVRLNCAGCTRPDTMGACKVDTDCPTGEPGVCQKRPLRRAGVRRANGYIGHTATTCTLGRRLRGAWARPRRQGLATRRSGHSGKCQSLITPTNLYELATSNYLAAGAGRVSASFSTKHDAVRHAHPTARRARRLPPPEKPCGWSSTAGTAEGLKACSTDVWTARRRGTSCARARAA